MCFAPLSPGSPSLCSFAFPAAFHNIINTLHSTNRKIPAPSHFQVILCILIRSSREKFDNTLELGPSFPWLLPENWLLKHRGHWIHKLLSAWKRLTPGCFVSLCIYQFRFIMEPLFLPKRWKLKPRPCACQGQTCCNPGSIPTQRFITFWWIAPSLSTWKLQNNTLGARRGADTEAGASLWVRGSLVYIGSSRVARATY